jgi:hypothetical protein
MKKNVMSIILLGVSIHGLAASADNSPILDQVSVALLGHTETVLETTTKGITRGEILVTPIQIGKWAGAYIIGLDGGVLGNVKPDSIGEAGYNWTAGIHFHLSPLLKRVMPKISPNYPALAALEINPRVSYLFRNRVNAVKGGWQVGLGIGWSFSATPQP